MANKPGIHNALITVIGVGKDTGDVQMGLLIDLAKQGVPNDPVVRWYLWELALHVLTPDRSKWESSTSSRHSLYWQWVEKYFENASNWLEMELPSGEVKVRECVLAHDEVMSLIHLDLVLTPNTMFADLGVGDTDD